MKTNRFVLVISILSLIGTFFIYSHLPPQIPAHWGLDGRVDHYYDRLFAFFTAVLPLLAYGLYHILPKIDPRKDNYMKHAGAYKIIRLASILYGIGFHWIMMVFALGYPINIIFLIKLLIAILFIILGNYMPVIKHNYTLGIRTPWTLANETVWEKTHRLGGYLWVISGIIWAAFAFVNQPWVMIVLSSELIICVIWTYLYSYLLFRNLSNIKVRA